MNDSSQVIHNVKKTATRVIQRYLGLLVEERCPDRESWIKEVERILEEACRRKGKESRHKVSYEAVIRQIEHIGLENVDMSSWDLTALRTIVLYIHPLEIWLPDAQYKLFVDIVNDKNYDSHESTNEPWEYVKPWSYEALDRIERFVESADGMLSRERYEDFSAASLKIIQETKDANREEFDEHFSLMRDLERQAKMEAHDIASSSDPLASYGAVFKKWLSRFPEDRHSSLLLWHKFNEALVSEGYTPAASNLAYAYYFGDDITPIDYSKAAYYFEIRGIENLLRDEKIQYAGLHLRGLIANASPSKGERILSDMECQSMNLCLAREHFYGRWIPRNYAKAATLYEASPTQRITPESDSPIMQAQDYANLASLYANGLVDGASPDKGRSLIEDLNRSLRGTNSTIETYQNEEGFTFYRVTRNEPIRFMG